MTTTVLLDAWHLAGSSANRGIGTYLRNVVPRLAADPDLDVVALSARDVELPPGVTQRTLRRIAPARFAQKEHELRLPFDIAKSTRTYGVDVVWSPADDPPSRSARPWVQFLHDVIPLVVDDPAFASSAARWRRIGARVREAAAVITNSHHTACDAANHLAIDSRRIHVAPLGVGPAFVPPRTRTQGPTPKILYVGEYGPHKGFAEAFDVVGGLADAGLPHRLVMAGYLAPWYAENVDELRARAPQPERIELAGYVDDLVGLYQGAEALIVTSRYEGFCLPALEAMACGTPVVAFSNSAIAEVVDGGGVLVPDGSVDAMVESLRFLLTDRGAWENASSRGLERSREFTWDRCADVHGRVFRSVAAES